MIESLSSWFTPTVLFCVLNLMIGTILITSTFRNNNDKKQHQQQEGEDHDLTQLPRTPYLLQRVRSVNFSFPDPFSSPLSSTHFPDNYGHSPSLLQRVRSINFSFSSRSAEKPSPFPSLDQDEQPHKDVETVTTRAEEEEEDLQCHVTRSKSAMCVETTERMLVEEEDAVVVRRRPATVREKKVGNIGAGTKSFGDDEAVDRKADDFISKFREQLKMQRVDSILRYKEMLNRGVSI
ncbi:hypothetical protein K7X08_030932 [Anisodus acutangulus]|uniref:DUF4408 domain-containing protein n=1 Tax=Anisodus acutangulus TaxID=402998 RepID=A0A9Q1RR56_9SOLA|nr:hypothetical protein K7X08_030932 [Anisodus acutangulus]